MAEQRNAAFHARRASDLLASADVDIVPTVPVLLAQAHAMTAAALALVELKGAING